MVVQCVRKHDTLPSRVTWQWRKHDSVHGAHADVDLFNFFLLWNNAFCSTPKSLCLLDVFSLSRL